MRKLRNQNLGAISFAVTCMVVSFSFAAQAQQIIPDPMVPPGSASARWVVERNGVASPTAKDSMANLSINMLEAFNAGDRIYLELSAAGPITSIDGLETQGHNLYLNCPKKNSPSNSIPMALELKQSFSPDRRSARVDLNYKEAFVKAAGDCQAAGGLAKEITAFSNFVAKVKPGANLIRISIASHNRTEAQVQQTRTPTHKHATRCGLKRV